jgi:hypothetical protein
VGGIIGLTVRFEKGREYRGSCHTNVLPEGMWAPAFYIDLDSSKRHVDTWLQTILDNRKKDPDLEEMWGGHDMLAPIEYGLVVVDYVTSTMISLQGYSGPDWIIKSHKEEKWAALEAAGLLTTDGRMRLDGMPAHWEARNIKMPFANLVIADVDEITDKTQTWCEENFGLTDAERAEWAAWFKAREE